MSKIIEKISSIVDKAGSLFIRHKLSMNESAARKIQKLVFEMRIAGKNGTYTPTYKKIAEQLNSKQDQIFESAVYHLVKIASSSKKFQNDILDILQKKADEPSLPIKRKEYIERKIIEIKQ